MPVRTALAFLLYFVNEEAIECGTECIAGHLILRWLAAATATVVLFGFIYSDYADKSRGFFGGPVWWKNMRRVHMLNYFGVAVFLFSNKYGSHYFLFADVIFSFLYAIVRKVFIFYV